MKSGIFFKYVFPFTLMYLLMIISTLVIDYLLHYFHLVYIGRQLGLVGTLLLIISFVYSLRKRQIIRTGSPKNLLLFHEYLAWIGSVILLVHSGIHFNALLPWLAVVMLLINVASGLVGKYLLKVSSKSVIEKRGELEFAGLKSQEIEKKLFFDLVMVDAMKKWRVIHLPIAFLFGILSLLHIISILIFIV